jgi:hypothetical protein
MPDSITGGVGSRILATGVSLGLAATIAKSRLRVISIFREIDSENRL